MSEVHVEAGNDDEKVKQAILTVLTAAPMIVWVVFVLWSGLADHSATKPVDIPDEFRLAGVASGTALATVAGSWLGIKKAQERIAKAVNRPSLSVNGWAAVVYFGGVAAALLFWVFDGEREYAAEVITTSLGTFIGFGLGAFKAATTPPT